MKRLKFAIFLFITALLFYPLVPLGLRSESMNEAYLRIANRLFIKDYNLFSNLKSVRLVPVSFSLITRDNGLTHTLFDSEKSQLFVGISRSNNLIAPLESLGRSNNFENFQLQNKNLTGYRFSQYQVSSRLRNNSFRPFFINTNLGSDIIMQMCIDNSHLSILALVKFKNIIDNKYKKVELPYMNVDCLFKRKK